jgi:hypothetical protein
MLYAFCLTADKGRPICFAISLALPLGKSFFSSVISSSDHATQVFFLILVFAVRMTVILCVLNSRGKVHS